MIVGVFGPRDHKGSLYNNYDYVASTLDEYEVIDQVITGGGAGVEQLALRYAEENNIPNSIVPPKIKQFGNPAAFKRRNQEIVQKVALVILFWDGRDTFYHDLISDALADKKIVHLRHVE